MSETALWLLGMSALLVTYGLGYISGFAVGFKNGLDDVVIRNGEGKGKA